MRSTRSSHLNRGSLLIVALLLCSVIGISLVSYLHLARTSLTISNRALYNNAAINLAENGLEEAMYSINRMIADEGYTWPRWRNNGSASTSDAWRRWSDYRFDQNATGYVRVYVQNYKGVVAPIIAVRASITLGGTSAAPIEKWIEVTLKKTSKFANGLVAKNSVVFNGTNTSVDSWNSDPDNDPLTAAERYPADPTPGVWPNEAAKDNGSVGSISVGVDAVLIKQADVWGFVSTGGVDPTSTIGSGGSVRGTGSPPGNVDPARISTDFSASFDPVAAPTKTYLTVPDTVIGGTGGASLELPLAADVAAARADADGNYYYFATRINLNSGNLRITGKVVLKLTETSTTSPKKLAVDVGGGSGMIDLPTGGSLAIYTAGDIKLTGQGAVNGVDTNGNGKIDDAEAKQPINFQIWGTKTTGVQDISVSGQGTISGIIYAPQGNVTITGNGSISGSVVANNITLTGNANFHYDESLGNFGGGNPFRVSKWKELTTADDRNRYTAQFVNNDYSDVVDP